jgi:hemoglobin-like flavoprotein
MVVRNLDEVSALREPLRDLGAQHVHWGARPEDYVTAREALIAAIRGLSVGWDAILEQHWRAAITAIVVPMLEGAAVHTALFAEQLATTGDPVIDA